MKIKSNIDEICQYFKEAYGINIDKYNYTTELHEYTESTLHFSWWRMKRSWSQFLIRIKNIFRKD
jgi:hypothetical protein